MNDISIHIDNLGPIRDADINVRPLMLFTGESGLGKSYLAFIANYTYAIVSLSSMRLLPFFSGLDFDSMLEGKKSGDVIYTVNISELFDWMNRDAVKYLAYMIGNPSLEGNLRISWPFDREKIEISYHEIRSGLDNDERVSYRISSENFNFNSEEKGVSQFQFSTLVKAELIRTLYGTDNIHFLNNCILPTSRGALMELSERPVFRSGMYEEFFKVKADIARPMENPVEEDALLTTLLKRVNDGTISQHNDAITYTTDSGQSIPLTAAASSIKEIAPLTMLLPKHDPDDLVIMFEEPEAHLHPARQQYLADLIGYIVSKGCHMQITTHSDYFIKRINTLMKLYPMAAPEYSGKIDELLNEHGIVKESLIDAGNVVAYNLSRGNGGTTVVTRLATDSCDGVPFDSFHDVITRYFELLSDMESIDDEKADSGE